MMPTKEIQEVYKNAQEVTSLETTDKVALIGADGVPKKIRKRLVSDVDMKTPNKSWIRIGNTSDYGISSLVVMSITELWNLGRPASLLLVASLGCCHQKEVLNVSEVKALSSNQRRNIIKARLVYDPAANTSYLDIIQDLYNNTIYIDFISVNNFSVNVKEAPDITSGMEVKELNIIFGGGVIYLLSNNYANTLKGGGLRDDAYERIDQRYRKECGYGCDGGQRKGFYELEQHIESRYLRCFSILGFNGFTERFLRIWYFGGYKIYCVSNATLHLSSKFVCEFNSRSICKNGFSKHLDKVGETPIDINRTIAQERRAAA